MADRVRPVPANSQPAAASWLFRLIRLFVKLKLIPVQISGNQYSFQVKKT